MCRKYVMMLAVLLAVAGSALADGKSKSFLNFTAVDGPATVSLAKVDSAPNVSLLYSTDDCKSWRRYECQVVQLKAGEKVFFKAEGSNYRMSYCGSLESVVKGYCKFVMRGRVAAGGDVMSLLDGTMQQTDVPAFAFYHLFAECSSLITAPSVSATKMAYCCCEGMFENCVSLVSAPALLAKVLAVECYREMFKGCASLVKAPALPASKMAVSCYQFMFSGCTSLVTPPTLPATALATSCYSNMFYDCISLVTPPALPATSMSKMCYEGMFIGCKSLSSVPALPARRLADYCYYAMFHNCTKLRMGWALPGKAWQIPSNAVVAGCTGWNLAMFDGTGGAFTGDPEVGVTYYVTQ